MDTIEQRLKEFLETRYRGWRVLVAPDKVAGGTGGLITVRGSHAPFQGLMGRTSVVTISVYHDGGADAAMRMGDEIVAGLDEGLTMGTLKGVSSLRFVSLPTLVANPSEAKGTAVVEVTCQTWARYRT